MKRTKIVCTIGPSSHAVSTLENMIDAGMNVARLNFSHGSYEDHADLIRIIRKASKNCKKPVAILQDLQGPRVRVGVVPSEGISLKSRQEVILVHERKIKQIKKADVPVIPIQVALHTVAKVGTHVLIQDGMIDLRVIAVVGVAVRCSVVQAGVILTHKGINVPGVTLPVPALTAKDKADAQFGISQGVDYMALSFVKDARDITALRRLLPEADGIRIIAKIERAEAIENIEAIIDVADGIMIARGDLGVELGSAPVPLLQKDIIERCILAGKTVIVATQMLESMIVNPRPTRAEASDVANAILDQTDAIMLSGESASGKFPVKAVQIMTRIARLTEKSEQRVAHNVLHSREWEVHDAIAHASVTLAIESRAKAIVVMGNDIDMLARIARFRPHAQQLILVTTNPHLATQAQLVWGVSVSLVKSFGAARSYTATLRRVLLAEGFKKNQRVVCVPSMVSLGTLTEELITL